MQCAAQAVAACLRSHVEALATAAVACWTALWVAREGGFLQCCGLGAVQAVAAGAGLWVPLSCLRRQKSPPRY